MLENVALIRRSKDAHGWMGNMAHYQVNYQGKSFPTSEHLFQCLRFNNPEIIEQIRTEPNPMKAKWIAKSKINEMSVVPLSLGDVKNMLLVLKLKIEQHPELKQLLKDTGDAVIIEDCTNRQGGTGLFWGAALVNDNWAGRNILGKLWMQIRKDI